MYARVSQHLQVYHKVENKDERKLLLSLESGRVNVRSSVCPVAGCGKSTTRIDRHLKSHTELSTATKDNALQLCKRKRVLAQLAALRATEPEVPLVSTLDLLPDIEDANVPFEEEEEEECSNPGCKEKVERLKIEKSRLNMSVETLTTAVRDVTRRYCRLQRRSVPKASGRLSEATARLLSSLRSGGDPLANTEVSTLPSASSDLEPSTSQQPPGFQEPESPPDHGFTLSEYTCIVLT